MKDGRCGHLVVLALLSVAGCEPGPLPRPELPPPPFPLESSIVRIEVRGLDGEEEGSPPILGLAIAHPSIAPTYLDHDGVYVLEVPVVAGTVLGASVSDQPDRPPRICELATSDVSTDGPALGVLCRSVTPCEGLFVETVGAITTERVYGTIDLGGLSMMELQPVGDEMLVTFREGVVGSFEPDGMELSTLLDIRERTESAADDGLVTATLHPSFPTVPSVFVLYVANAEPRSIRLSRFELDAEGERFDPASETILLEEAKTPDSNSHTGGVVRFGSDGLLYASIGDGGYVEPASRNGQELDNVLGTMIRIDVDGGMPYAIPADNPFSPSGPRPDEGLPEIFAWGFRNPFRWSFDRATGSIWLGDVGAGNWEEIDVVEGGANYGWPVMEGHDCLDEDCDPALYREPLLAYPHPLGSSAVVGGYVYDGEDLPSLRGAYLFSDFNRGQLFALLDPYGMRELVEVVAVDFAVVNVGPDERGEPLIVGLDRVARVVPNAGARTTLPSALSETGCMDPDDRTAVAPSFEPYTVRSPLWSDGATKDRFLLVPADGVVRVRDGGDLDVPVGSVLVKEFRRDGRLLETRVVARLARGWNMATYRWDDDGADAWLVESATVEEAGGAPWFFPGSGECRRCHTEGAGFTLGLELRQLDVDTIGRFAARGWIDPGDPHGDLVRPDDEMAPAVDRVRAYLHANCANCHRPGASMRPRLDLRVETPLAETGLCDAPLAESFGLAHVVEAGDPDRSILVRRIGTRTSARMPPLGSEAVDEVSVALVREWIASLASCP